jgi:hypothetical protein
MLEGYFLSDIDDAGTVKYYGYLNEHGNWLIRKEDTTVTPKTHRFAYGTRNYLTNMNNRASLVYDLLSTVLKNISS